MYAMDLLCLYCVLAEVSYLHYSVSLLFVLFISGVGHTSSKIRMCFVGIKSCGEL